MVFYSYDKEEQSKILSLTFFNVASKTFPLSEVNIKISSNTMYNISSNTMWNVPDIGRVFSKSVFNLDEDFINGNIGNHPKAKYLHEHVASSPHKLFHDKKKYVHVLHAE